MEKLVRDLLAGRPATDGRSAVNPDNHAAVPDQVRYWNHWHRKSRADLDPEHTKFREGFLSLLSRGSDSMILELGCGQGQDARVFGAAGFQVDACDVAENAIRSATQALPKSMEGHVRFHVWDIAGPLPVADRQYSAVYSYLSLHYFDEVSTRRIFDEVYRVLRPAGLLGFVVRSVNDRLYGKGGQLGPDTYCLDGHVRHFFSRSYVRGLLTGWTVLSAVEFKGTYVGAQGVDTFLAVIARHPHDHMTGHD
ncbi:MAG TPA: class I SAM-dependent methyltransferase [Micromonosporaceae bacterium]